MGYQQSIGRGGRRKASWFQGALTGVVLLVSGCASSLHTIYEHTFLNKPGPEDDVTLRIEAPSRHYSLSRGGRVIVESQAATCTFFRNQGNIESIRYEQNGKPVSFPNPGSPWWDELINFYLETMPKVDPRTVYAKPNGKGVEHTLAPETTGKTLEELSNLPPVEEPAP